MKYRDPIDPVASRESLIRRMRALAKKSSPYHAQQLHEKADALEKAIETLTQDNAGTMRLLGAWARARRYYCDLTGEPLI